MCLGHAEYDEVRRVERGEVLHHRNADHHHRGDRIGEDAERGFVVTAPVEQLLGDEGDDRRADEQPGQADQQHG